MRAAALDLGTNSFLCLVVEGTGKIEKVLADEIRITRLGAGVHETRRISAEALERAEEAFVTFSSILSYHNCDVVKAVATSAARDAENFDALLQLGNKYQIPIEVITGLQEAEMTFRGATHQRVRIDDTAVLDIGGGSTEIIYKPVGLDIMATSFDVGCVRLTEIVSRHDPLSDFELREMVNRSQVMFENLKDFRPKELIGVGGTPTAIACAIRNVYFNELLVEGYVIRASDLDAQIEKMASMSNDLRAAIKGVGPKRSDIIVAGAVILREAMRTLGQESVTVSTKGLRFGLAADLLGMKSEI
ncbi:MAG: hypothetical protein K2X47_09600 [Bdellovibrionales bacterium]|nr:hypothetical protein [Bdellovibrionales bacterium]